MRMGGIKSRDERLRAFLKKPEGLRERTFLDVEAEAVMGDHSRLGAEGAEALLDEAQLRDLIERTLLTLTPREETAVKLRFFENMTYQDIGRHFRTSNIRARLILDKALRKLRHPTRARALEEWSVWYR
jgi:RNA polymerase primary sigma factor